MRGWTELAFLTIQCVGQNSRSVRPLSAISWIVTAGLPNPLDSSGYRGVGEPLDAVAITGLGGGQRVWQLAQEQELDFQAGRDVGDAVAVLLVLVEVLHAGGRHGGRQVRSHGILCAVGRAQLAHGLRAERGRVATVSGI